MSTSTPRDVRTYLWDALEASGHVLVFIADRTFAQYVGDVLLRSGVERQLEIVGEALNQMSKVDADFAARIPQLRSVVGFRNVIAHGYRELDDGIVWSIAKDKLPEMRELLQALLDELNR